MADLKTEIEQRAPFATLEEEALLNLLRSAELLQRALQLRTRPWGLTLTQYNVLRILRGAGEKGMTCSEIGRRMIAAEPDMTRLLARMKEMGWIEQQRLFRDRRAVWSSITETGLRLLESMTETMRAAPLELLAGFTEEQLRAFIALLEQARAASSPQQSE